MKFIRRPFTLLEILVAMGLLLLILVTLSYFYYQLELINAEEERVEKQTFKMRYLENRLSTVIPHILQVGTRTAFGTKKQDKFFFTTQNSVGGGVQSGSKSLIFNFDNGLSLEKTLSSRVTGRLYLDDKGNLTLAMWPVPSKWPESGSPVIKKEILMTGVEDLAFGFYVAPEEEQEQEIKPNTPSGKSEKMEPGPKGSWLEEWRPEYQEIPAMLRLTIRYKEGESVKTATFAYPLPGWKTPILYSI